MLAEKWTNHMDFNSNGHSQRILMLCIDLLPRLLSSWSSQLCFYLCKNDMVFITIIFMRFGSCYVLLCFWKVHHFATY
uniref:Uncharacterized protein n=1 Tax=Wuchereria bancrofti TaxID=6293 RepID=A0A1I8EFT8_WUCBA